MTARPEIDLYLRKSKRVREGERALTFRSQEAKGRAWAEANGYAVRKVWADNLSAYSDIKRPQFEKALKALKNGEVPALWAYALDRFSRRGAADVVPILGKARVIFNYEGLDSASERDRRWIIMKAEDAREYSSRLSQGVRDTKARQRDEGAWLSAAPYGLRIADTRTRKLEHHPDEWPVILRIYESAASGISARKLAGMLTADGIPSPSGGVWGASTIRRILRNAVYEGWQVVAKSKRDTTPILYRDRKGNRVPVFAEGVEPVPADLVKRARRVQAGHQRGNLGARAGVATHLLTDLLRCAGCGAAMCVMSLSYVCNGHASGKPCPAPAYAMRKHIDAYVERVWSGRLSAAEPTDPIVHIVAERWQLLTATEEVEEATEALAAVKEAEAAIEQLANDRAAGLYSGAMGKHFPRLVKEAEAALAGAQKRAKSFADQTVNIGGIIDHIQLGSAWENAELPIKRDLIRLAIDRIDVCKAPRRGAPWDGDARVSITWADEDEQPA